MAAQSADVLTTERQFTRMRAEEMRIPNFIYKQSFERLGIGEQLPYFNGRSGAT